MMSFEEIVMSYRLWRVKRLVRKTEEAIRKININAPIEDRMEFWRQYREDEGKKGET